MSGTDKIDLDDNSLHAAVGEAIEAYAGVEKALAHLLQHILAVNANKAHTILFAVQNSRSRNEMFQSLLNTHFGGKLKKYWASCSSYLLTLGTFRNAVAHWHHTITVYVPKDDSEPVSSEPTLGHPVFGNGYEPLTLRDFPAFLRDCQYIRQELSALTALVRKPPDTLPEKFQRPIARRNQAVLQLRRKPTAQQHQRPPSPQSDQNQKKRSSAQRRKEAIARAKRAHQPRT